MTDVDIVFNATERLLSMTLPLNPPRKEGVEGISQSAL